MYDADTMTLYQERFAGRVISVILQLRQAGRLGASEAHELAPPLELDAIEKLGQRLIELSYSITV